jgi:hypothetical protein
MGDFAKDFQDAADSSRACCQPNVILKPEDPGYLRQFIFDHGMEREDAEALMQFVDGEVGRIMAERFNRIIEFFKACGIPKLVVFAVISTQGGMKMTEIAKQCGVSKQAIHKAFRTMEPVFARHVTGYERRRRFTKKINGD